VPSPRYSGETVKPSTSATRDFPPWSRRDVRQHKGPEHRQRAASAARPRRTTRRTWRIPIAIFSDEIYYGTLASFDADFFDVQQLAILRGPQGTDLRP
jgi:hypothetical protein